MHSILDKALALLREEGIREVYASFDAVPLPDKSDRLFTVVGLESVQMEPPFPDGSKGVHPFTATLKVSVLVPMTSPVGTAEKFYYEMLLPVLLRLGAVQGETVPASVNIKLGKVVMSGLLRIRGLYAEWDEPEEDAPEDAPEDVPEESL